MEVDVDKAMNSLVSIDHLAAGQSGRVRRIDGLPADVHRLEEFGLHSGTKVQMFRPGNPCIIRLRGHKICLRSDDLLRVLVKPARAEKR